MKNLKKLSVAVMLAALFITSFTSCIDDEVDPIVEAIYAAQADLLAAQARVQDAEATLLEAQANAEQAAADRIAAITAAQVATAAQALIRDIAATELAVEEARIAMLLAQAEFDQDLAQIAAAIRQASNVEAGIHAADYATAMGELAALKVDRMTLLANIATKELYMKSVVVDAEMTWEVYLAGLAREVLAKEASVTANEAYIVRANAYLGDYDAMVLALAAAEAAVTANLAADAALDAEDSQIDADIAVSGTFDDFQTAYEALLGELNGYKGAITTLEGEIETLTDETIPGLEAVVADYDATTDLLEAAVTAATARIGAEEDDNHPSGHAAGFGLLGDIEVIENTVGTVITTGSGGGGAAAAGDDPVEMDDNAPFTSLTLFEELFNAEIAAADTAKDVADMEADFAAQVATYNAAAAALAGATDPSTTAGLLVDALDDQTDATTALGVAQAAYTAALTAFEADPSGSNETDASISAVDDLGEVGTLGNVKTYMRVATWVQTGLGTGLYVPASFAAGQYTAATLVTEVDAIIADTAAPNDMMIAGDETETVLWEQDGTAVDVDGGALTSSADVAITGDIDPDGTTAVVGTNGTAFTTELVVGDYINVNGEVREVTAIADDTNLTVGVAFTDTANDTTLLRVTYEHDKIATGDVTLTAAEVLVADNNDVIYFVEVEDDDTVTPYLNTFNIATNELGTDDFASKWFTSDGDPKDGTNTWVAALAFGDANAGYDADWDGAAAEVYDTLTAQAALWNANLAVEIATYNADVVLGDLADLEAAFAAEKELFDNGVANIAALQVLDDTADDAVDDAGDAISDANDAKGLLEDELGGADYAGRATNDPGNLPLSWDVHANDGLAVGSEVFDYLVSAEWDSTDDGDADSLTAYAALWNAENALAIHEDTSLAGYNTLLTAALQDVIDKTNLIAENQILVDRWQADIDALTAAYDALVATPLYAAQQVRLLEIADEIAVLAAENAVLDAEVVALAITISFEGLGTIALIDAAIVAAQDVIDGAPAFYDLKAAQIALGEVTVANLEAEVEKLNADLVDLDAEIAAKAVEAAGYLALLNAALAS